MSEVELLVDGVALLDESELAPVEESVLEEVSSFLEPPFALDPEPFA